MHGSWRKDDANGLGIKQAAQQFANVEEITAYMPEAYGTHHSKMMILFRHDGLAQVNMFHAIHSKSYLFLARFIVDRHQTTGQQRPY